MKARVLIAALLAGGIALADSTTPRLGLTVPDIGSTGWGTKTNNNWNSIDAQVVTPGLSNTFTADQAFANMTVANGKSIMFLPSSGGSGALIYNPFGLNYKTLVITSPDGVTAGNGIASFPGTVDFLVDGTHDGKAEGAFAVIGSSANNSGTYTGFIGTSSVDQSTLWSLPRKDGTNGQAMITDGSGHLSFGTVSGGGNFINNQSTLQSGATFYVSSGTVAGNFRAGGNDFPTNSGSSGQFLQTNGSGGLSWQTPIGGGGGASSLAVYSNSISVSSPTALINFKSPLIASLAGSATSTITVDPSSVTLLGPRPSLSLTSGVLPYSVSLSTGVMGNLPVANLNSGTSASGSTFWRGDGTWATPAASSSSIAVYSNGVQASSPTALLNFKAPLVATLAGGATSLITVDPSSVTLQGNTIFPASMIPVSSSGIAFGSASNTITQNASSLKWDNTNNQMTILTGTGGRGIVINQPNFSGAYSQGFQFQQNGSNTGYIQQDDYTSLCSDATTTCLSSPFEIGWAATPFYFNSDGRLFVSPTGSRSNAYSSVIGGSLIVGGTSGFNYTDILKIGDGSLFVNRGIKASTMTLTGLGANLPIQTDANSNLITAAISLSSSVVGNLPVANLNSGSGATSSTFWRGDGSWATPAGGGGGSSSLAVSSGSVQISSPTAILRFNGNDFNLALTGSATAAISLNPNTTDFIHNQATLQSGSTAYPDFLYVATSASITGPLAGSTGVFTSTVTALSYSMTGTGNPSFQVSGDPTWYQIIGTSVTPTVGQYAQFSTSHTVIGVPTPTGGSGSAPSGNNFDVLVASNAVPAGFDNFTNNGTTVTLAFIGTRTETNVTTQTAVGVFFDYSASSVTISSVTVQGALNAGSMAGAGLSTCGDSTHALAWSSSNNLFTCQSIAGTGGGGGSSTLAVAIGSSSWTNQISSPTAAIEFDRSQFSGVLQGGSTAFLTIAYSSNSVTANYTTVSTDTFVNANCASACTVTLSNPPFAGKVIMVAQGGAGNVTLSPATGTISGGSTALMNQQYSELDIYWDGKNWTVK